MSIRALHEPTQPTGQATTQFESVLCERDRRIDQPLPIHVAVEPVRFVKARDRTWDTYGHMAAVVDLR